MEALRFKNLVFKPGINVTVRLGRKWHDNLHLFSLENPDWTGDVPVEIKGVEDNSVVTHFGLVEFAACVSFFDIPQEWLDLEHDPACRTLDGLYLAMKEVYGDAFAMGERVSVLFFTVEENGSADNK